MAQQDDSVRGGPLDHLQIVADAPAYFTFAAYCDGSLGCVVREDGRILEVKEEGWAFCNGIQQNDEIIRIDPRDLSQPENSSAQVLSRLRSDVRPLKLTLKRTKNLGKEFAVVCTEKKLGFRYYHSYVVEVKHNTWADTQAGMLAGDKLVSIDGLNCENASPEEMLAALRKPRPTKILVFRPKSLEEAVAGMTDGILKAKQPQEDPVGASMALTLTTLSLAQSQLGEVIGAGTTAGGALVPEESRSRAASTAASGGSTQLLPGTIDTSSTLNIPQSLDVFGPSPEQEEQLKNDGGAGGGRAYKKSNVLEEELHIQDHWPDDLTPATSNSKRRGGSPVSSRSASLGSQTTNMNNGGLTEKDNHNSLPMNTQIWSPHNSSSSGVVLLEGGAALLTPQTSAAVLETVREDEEEAVDQEQPPTATSEDKDKQNFRYVTKTNSNTTTTDHRTLKQEDRARDRSFGFISDEEEDHVKNINTGELESRRSKTSNSNSNTIMKSSTPSKQRGPSARDLELARKLGKEVEVSIATHRGPSSEDVALAKKIAAEIEERRAPSAGDLELIRNVQQQVHELVARESREKTRGGPTDADTALAKKIAAEIEGLRAPRADDVKLAQRIATELVRLNVAGEVAQSRERLDTDPSTQQGSSSSYQGRLTTVLSTLSNSVSNMTLSSPPTKETGSGAGSSPVVLPRGEDTVDLDLTLAVGRGGREQPLTSPHPSALKGGKGGSSGGQEMKIPVLEPDHVRFQEQDDNDRRPEAAKIAQQIKKGSGRGSINMRTRSSTSAPREDGRKNAAAANSNLNGEPPLTRVMGSSSSDPSNDMPSISAADVVRHSLQSRGPPPPAGSPGGDQQQRRHGSTIAHLVGVHDSAGLGVKKTLAMKTRRSLHQGQHHFEDGEHNAAGHGGGGGVVDAAQTESHAQELQQAQAQTQRKTTPPNNNRETRPHRQSANFANTAIPMPAADHEIYSDHEESLFTSWSLSPRHQVPSPTRQFGVAEDSPEQGAAKPAPASAAARRGPPRRAEGEQVGPTTAPQPPSDGDEPAADEEGKRVLRTTRNTETIQVELDLESTTVESNWRFPLPNFVPSDVMEAFSYYPEKRSRGPAQKKSKPPTPPSQRPPLQTTSTAPGERTAQEHQHQQQLLSATLQTEGVEYHYDEAVELVSSAGEEDDEVEDIVNRNPPSTSTTSSDENSEEEILNSTLDEAFRFRESVVRTGDRFRDIEDLCGGSGTTTTNTVCSSSSRTRASTAAPLLFYNDDGVDLDDDDEEEKTCFSGPRREEVDVVDDEDEELWHHFFFGSDPAGKNNAMPLPSSASASSLIFYPDAENGNDQQGSTSTATVPTPPERLSFWRPTAGLQQRSSTPADDFGDRLQVLEEKTALLVYGEQRFSSSSHQQEPELGGAKTPPGEQHCHDGIVTPPVETPDAGTEEQAQDASASAPPTSTEPIACLAAVLKCFNLCSNGDPTARGKNEHSGPKEKKELVRLWPRAAVLEKGRLERLEAAEKEKEHNRELGVAQVVEVVEKAEDRGDGHHVAGGNKHHQRTTSADQFWKRVNTAEFRTFQNLHRALASVDEEGQLLLPVASEKNSPKTDHGDEGPPALFRPHDHDSTSATSISNAARAEAVRGGRKSVGLQVRNNKEPPLQLSPEEPAPPPPLLSPTPSQASSSLTTSGERSLTTFGMYYIRGEKEGVPKAVKTAQASFLTMDLRMPAMRIRRSTGAGQTGETPRETPRRFGMRKLRTPRAPAPYLGSIRRVVLSSKRDQLHQNHAVRMTPRRTPRNGATPRGGNGNGINGKNGNNGNGTSPRANATPRKRKSLPPIAESFGKAVQGFSGAVLPASPIPSPIAATTSGFLFDGLPPGPLLDPLLGSEIDLGLPMPAPPTKNFDASIRSAPLTAGPIAAPKFVPLTSQVVEVPQHYVVHDAARAHEAEAVAINIEDGSASPSALRPPMEIVVPEVETKKYEFSTDGEAMLSQMRQRVQAKGELSF